MINNKEESTAVSSIGTGHMARIPGTLAVEGSNAVEVTGRDPAKAGGRAVPAPSAGTQCLMPGNGRKTPRHASYRRTGECCSPSSQAGRPSGAGTHP
jgi:hypothetical protein